MLLAAQETREGKPDLITFRCEHAKILADFVEPSLKMAKQPYIARPLE